MSLHHARRSVPFVFVSALAFVAIAQPAAAVVTGAGIRDSSITTVDIARDTLIGADIRTNAIGTLELSGNAVRTSDILDGSITMRDLDDNSVGVSQIAADAVRASELASGSVAGSEIADNAVGRSELGDDAVGSAELDENSVTGSHIATSAIGTSDIAVNGVGASEIATGGVTTSEVLDGTIGTLDLAPGAVTPDKVAPAPSVALTFVAAQSVLDGVATPVLPAGGWGEAYDQGGMHDDPANLPYVVAPVAGWYQVSGRLEWAADGGTIAQDRRLSIITSTSTGTDMRAAARVQDTPAGTSVQQQSVSGLVRLAAGDRIWLEAYQTNDGNQPISVTADVSADTRGAAFSAVWVAP
ncbi:MAG: hypothetical protein JWL76_1636 [Thermoleophilia bacterium]|nr:hypothetical protein [Thermoleophilia bacterium]